jgi:exonuclease III
LQEIKCTNAAFPHRALKAAGYGAIWAGQGPHHGVAILARSVDPIETARELPGGKREREARYIEAAIEGGHRTANGFIKHRFMCIEFASLHKEALPFAASSITALAAPSS